MPRPAGDGVARPSPPRSRIAGCGGADSETTTVTAGAADDDRRPATRSGS